MSLIKLHFWSKTTGNFMSHGAGLTMEQIEELQKLKEGDRLILWKNARKSEKDAFFTLKVFKDDTPKDSL